MTGSAIWISPPATDGRKYDGEKQTQIKGEAYEPVTVTANLVVFERS
jgi:hypothetical protein